MRFPSRCSARISVLLALAGCGSGEVLPGPSLSGLLLTINITGAEIDPDGYILRIDESLRLIIGASAILEQDDLNPGDYIIALEGIVFNCVVDGVNPRSVTLVVGSSLAVDFDVRCSARLALGALEVLVIMIGDEPDDAYELFLDLSSSHTLLGNGTVLVSDLEAGVHALCLSGVAGNCVVSGDNPIEVIIALGEIVSVTFSINCWPALRGQIAFIRSFQVDLESTFGIHVMNADGTGLIEVLFSVFFPSWSADGSRLAFVFGFSIYMMEDFNIFVSFQGCMSTDFLSFSLEASPQWSSDGKFLCVEFGSAMLYAIGADGSGRTELLPDTLEVRSVIWGPDGFVVFHCASRSSGGSEGICIVRSDGIGLARLVIFAPEDPRWMFIESGAPIWSADGSIIAFHRRVCDDFSFCLSDVIYLVNLDGSGLRTLIGQLEKPSGSAWFFEGSCLAFVSNQIFSGRIRADLFVVNVDGTDRTNLTNHPAVYRNPEWSPDGIKLVFSVSRFFNESNGFEPNEESDLYVINADGSNLVLLTTVGRDDLMSFFNEDPTWKP